MSATKTRAPLIMIIRHGEKPPDPPMQPPPFGVTFEGNQDNHSLSVRGWQRAGALTTFFAPPSYGTCAPGISTPNYIYAFKTDADSDYTDNAASASGKSKSKRAQQTVAPLVEKLGRQVSLNIAYEEGDVVGVADSAMACDGVVLICWEHHIIPEIASTFCLDPNTPVPQKWPDEQGEARFDLVWVFTYSKTNDWYQFSQVPQLLLVGDMPV